MPSTIDLQATADRADLPALMASEGIEVVRGMAFCPFHDNHTTRALSIYQDAKRRWRFKCHGCQVKGDALEWLVRRNHGMTVIEAARIIDPSIADADHSAPVRPRRVDVPHQLPPRPHLETVEVWRDREWQAECDRIVCLAESHLWSSEGKPARRWLHARGIEDHTARFFRLGWLDHDVWSRPVRALADADKPAGRRLWAPRGITIPWAAPGGSYPIDEEDDPAAPRWCGCNVRRLGELVDDERIFGPLPEGVQKCRALKGPRRGYAYPHPDLSPSQAGLPALIVEGEWDALIAHQDAGNLVHAFTVGGATTTPQSSALAFLDQCPIWLLATDHDDAGATSAETWIDRGEGRARPMILPLGKDLTDFRKAGGDVAEWIHAKLVRLNLNQDRVSLTAVPRSGRMSQPREV